MPERDIQINENIFKIASGNKSALAELYELLKSRLITVSFYYTKNKEDSKDILQETFIVVAKKAYLFRGSSGASWVEKICRNLCLDFLRKKKRRATVSEDMLEGIPDDRNSFENALIKEDIQTALKKLSKKEFEVIINLYFFDYSFKEVSNQLNIKQDTIYKIHNRAIIKLKKFLNGDGINGK